MNSSGLKAREIEALTFIYSPQHTAAPEHRRTKSVAKRATTAGVIAGALVIAALAWFLLPY
jgi:hypothetical protein